MQSSKRESRTNRVRTATVELPVANEVPVFADFLAESQRRFDVEKNIKNNLLPFSYKKA